MVTRTTWDELTNFWFGETRPSTLNERFFTYKKPLPNPEKLFILLLQIVDWRNKNNNMELSISRYQLAFKTTNIQIL